MTDLERYNKDKATVMSMVKFILMILIIAALLFIAARLVTVMVPFLIGFLLAKTSYAIATPIAKKFSPAAKYKETKRKLSVAVYCVLMVIIAILIVLCCSMLYSQCLKAIGALTNFATNFDVANFSSQFIRRFSSDNGGFLTPEIIQTIEDSLYKSVDIFVERVPSIVTGVLSSIWAMVGNIPYGIFVVICVILSGYYFINDGPNVLKTYMKNVPNKSFRMKSVSLLNDLSVTLFRALGGYLSLLIITAVEAWLAFKIAGVNYAVILALLTAIIDFLPVLGVSATMIPAMIYLAVHNNFRGVVILIIALALMTIIRRIIEPAILGKSLHLHPLMMLLGMAIGVYIWGAIGFLLGPTVLIIIIDVFRVFSIDKKIANFMSRVLSSFMKEPEDNKSKA